MYIAIVAGGTGGHIFPALSVARVIQQKHASVPLLWIGTARNREREICEKHDIPIKILAISGMKRAIHVSTLIVLWQFIHATMHMIHYFRKNRPQSIIAFGGYVAAPVLAAAVILGIPYFLQEQNSVPGLVNRMFSSRAVCTFLGFPLNTKYTLKGNRVLTGTPVRAMTATYDRFSYPRGFKREEGAVLVCGGSQGAASMNECLVEPISELVEKGMQVCWQTGSYSYAGISKRFSSYAHAFIFETIDDLYPFYAAATCVICRAGASTLSEIACFGLPCVIIPLPWATENHQWINAQHVQQQGWGICVEQNDTCGKTVRESIAKMLTDKVYYSHMAEKARECSPIHAADEIVNSVMKNAG